MNKFDKMLSWLIIIFMLVLFIILLQHLDEVMAGLTPYLTQFKVLP